METQKLNTTRPKLPEIFLSTLIYLSSDKFAPDDIRRNAKSFYKLIVNQSYYTLPNIPKE